MKTFILIISFGYMVLPALSFAQTPTPTAVNGLCKRVVAYYTSWTSGSYSASTVPYTQLTHINYAFVTPNSDGSLNDIYGNPYTGGSLGSDCASLVSNAHANGVKVLISIGGAGVPASTFSTLAASSAALTAFVNNAYGMAVSNSFDGVDIDWEYPQSAADKANFDALMQGLRNKFNASPAPAPNWLISAALSPDSYYAGFLDLPTLAGSMNFFNIMIYDYHGSWTSHSGHNAALYQATGDLAFSHTGDDGADAVGYFTSHGAPASQINYGLAFYGYAFNTPNIFVTCPNGNCSTQTLPYNQIAPLIGSGWTRYWDNSAMSPYLLNGGTSMITYDDQTSILAKANYALNSANVGGVFTWALNQDYVSAGNQPLLNAMDQMASLCGSATPTPFPTYTPFPTATPSFTPTPWVAGTFRVNSGGPAYTDSQGNAWAADTQYSGGSGAAVTNAIAKTSDPTLYQSERWGSFTYTFNALPGSYQVTLKFAEIYWNAAGKRQFNVSINGAQVLSNFDVFADAGGEFIADDKVFNNISPNVSGQIVISYSAGAADQPKSSAIQILPMPATPTPTATPTATFTPTFTDTPCMVNGTPCTSTPTPSATPTVPSGGKILVYPNPVEGPGGTTLHVLLSQPSDVKVKIFSLSFRFVREEDFPGEPAGPHELPVDLHDKISRELANGLYYLVVDSADGRFVEKLLVIR